MSVIKPEVRRLHHFYRSGPMPCPYIPGRVERKLFTRLTGSDAPLLNSVLSQAGFRRSHDIVYRPVCAGCQACVPVRIPADQFKPSRTQRRIRRVNADLIIHEVPAHATIEQFALFSKYQAGRHGDSDMARMTRADYAAMVEEGGQAASLLEFRTPDGRLIGAMLADRLADGFSAVYSFFDPAEARRSLGTYMVIGLVDLIARADNMYVYLGYWIDACRKMSYKAMFRPLEVFADGAWVRRDLVVDDDKTSEGSEENSQLDTANASVVVGAR